MRTNLLITSIILLAAIPNSHVQSNTPDHIILTHNDNPATTQSVTWRTESSLEKALAHKKEPNANFMLFTGNCAKMGIRIFRISPNNPHISV